MIYNGNNKLDYIRVDWHEKVNRQPHTQQPMWITSATIQLARVVKVTNVLPLFFYEHEYSRVYYNQKYISLVIFEYKLQIIRIICKRITNYKRMDRVINFF